MTTDRKVRDAAYYAANKDRIAKRTRIYYQDNIEKIKARRSKHVQGNKQKINQVIKDKYHSNLIIKENRKLSAKAWIDQNPELHMLRLIKYRATKVGARFNLTI